MYDSWLIAWHLTHYLKAQNGQKLELVENKIQEIFMQCLVLNKTVTPLLLVGNEFMIHVADSALRTSPTTVSKSSYPTMEQLLL